jgi:polyisoprenoid-binding protein YceI
MNRLLPAVFALFALPALAAPQSASMKGQTKWISDAPVEKIVGTAAGTAELKIDLADLSTLKGKISFSVDSMMTGNAMRDGHLKSPTWLDATQFPEITFDIISAKVLEAPTGDAVKAAKVEATGKFTLHGVSTDMTIPATLKWKGDKLKISADFNVKLAEYKVEGKAGVVGNKVGDTIAITATLKGKIQ